MIDLKVDFEKNKVFIKAHLKGDAEPLTLEVDNFELSGDSESGAVVIHEAHSDRAWVDAILQNALVGKSLPVKGQVLKMIRGLF